MGKEGWLKRGYLFSYLLLLFVTMLGYRNNWFPYLSYSLPFFLLTFILCLSQKWEIIWDVLGNRIIVNLLVLFFVIFMSVKIVFEYYSIRYSIWDTGIFSNSLINFNNGYGFFSSILQVPQLSDHFCPNLLLLSPLFKLFPNGIVLIVVRFLIFIFSIFLVKQLCKVYEIDKEKTNFFTIVWILNLGMFGVLDYEFQPSSLVIPFIFLMLIFYRQKRYILLSVCCVFILGFKEQTAIIIIFLGAYIFMIEKKYWRGIAISATGLMSGLLIFFVLTPLLSGVPNTHASYFDPFANFTEKVGFFLNTLATTGFMPMIFGLKYLVIIIPGYAFNLVTNQLNATTLSFHYQDIACTVVFCTSIIGFSESQIKLQDKGWIYNVFFAFTLCCIFFINNKFPTYELDKSKPTKYSMDLIANIEKFRSSKFVNYSLYAQDCIGFYFSDKFKLATYGMSSINPAENHCVILADSANPWPLTDVHQEVIKFNKLKETGEYKQLNEYYPLLVFVKETN